MRSRREKVITGDDHLVLPFSLHESSSAETLIWKKTCDEILAHIHIGMYSKNKIKAGRLCLKEAFARFWKEKLTVYIYVFNVY